MILLSFSFFVGVAPFTGAWIEIITTKDTTCYSVDVAPFTGAWIEIITTKDTTCYSVDVAPFTGAWIEILLICKDSQCSKSHPSRVRGLK